MVVMVDHLMKPGGDAGGSYGDLINLLQSIDNNSYPAYKSMESYQKGWKYTGAGVSGQNTKFTLYIEKVQSDPYTPPTWRCKTVVPNTTVSFLPSLYKNRTSSAIADYVHRAFYHRCLAFDADKAVNSDTEGGGRWSGPKGGDIFIDMSTRHMLEQQTAVQFDLSSGTIPTQLTMNLPARGQTILGRKAISIEIVQTILPSLVQKSLIYTALDCNKLHHHVLSITDQYWLWDQLKSQNLVAFIPNGALLSRASGSDDRPMDANDDSNNLVLSK